MHSPAPLRRAWHGLAALLALAPAPSLPAAESGEGPRPTPVTRPAMKRLLEDMKARPERIPLPEPSAEEIAAAGDDAQALSYENRLRALFLPATELRGYLGFGGSAPRRPGAPAPKVVIEPDPAVTLDYGFKTRLFWIASRANNCQYCLGHQESKLLAVGMTDDDLARLDADWSGFPEREQAAFAFARKLSLAPGSVSDADVAACLAHYSPKEVLEMALSVGGNNAINRWKEGIGVPQSPSGGNSGWAQARPDGSHSYLTPTADRFAATASAVAVLGGGALGEGLVATGLPAAPARHDEIRAALAAARARSPRLPLVDEAEARTILGAAAGADGPVPGWMRLLAWFPVAGPRMARAFLLSAEAPGIDPTDRALLRWTVARRNRAWYALSLAEADLRRAGFDDARLADLAGDQATLDDARRAVLVVADTLAASPVACTDAQFRRALEATSPATMTRVVHEVAMESLLDRFTEAAGLPAE
ncbi:MAG: carboxymuconolactone decarboxylase family protein [Planctomycetaceae bacterium]